MMLAPLADGAGVVDTGIVAMGAGLDVLATIRRPAVELAIWRRGLPESLNRLAALDWTLIEDIDIECPGDTLPHLLPGLLATHGYPSDPATDALGKEIASLAARFAAILDCEELRIRLEVVETDACHKFHSDYVTARLLTTLVGAATQWRHMAPEADIIQSLDTGDVALFKGRLWADPPAIVHRSPPANGVSRLLLAIDPL